MSRVNNDLEFDQSAFDANAALVQAQIDAEQQSETDYQTAKSELLDAVQNWSTLTAAQQKKVARNLIKLVLRA